MKLYLLDTVMLSWLRTVRVLWSLAVDMSTVLSDGRSHNGSDMIGSLLITPLKERVSEPGRAGQGGRSSVVVLLLCLLSMSAGVRADDVDTRIPSALLTTGCVIESSHQYSYNKENSTVYAREASISLTQEVRFIAKIVQNFKALGLSKVEKQSITLASLRTGLMVGVGLQFVFSDEQTKKDQAELLASVPASVSAVYNVFVVQKNSEITSSACVVDNSLISTVWCLENIMTSIKSAGTNLVEEVKPEHYGKTLVLVKQSQTFRFVPVESAVGTFLVQRDNLSEKYLRSESIMDSLLCQLDRQYGKLLKQFDVHVDCLKTCEASWCLLSQFEIPDFNHDQYCRGPDKCNDSENRGKRSPLLGLIRDYDTDISNIMATTNSHMRMIEELTSWGRNASEQFNKLSQEVTKHVNDSAEVLDQEKLKTETILLGMSLNQEINVMIQRRILLSQSLNSLAHDMSQVSRYLTHKREKIIDLLAGDNVCSDYDGGLSCIFSSLIHHPSEDSTDDISDGPLELSGAADDEDITPELLETVFHFKIAENTRRYRRVYLVSCLPMKADTIFQANLQVMLMNQPRYYFSADLTVPSRCLTDSSLDPLNDDECAIYFGSIANTRAPVFQHGLYFLKHNGKIYVTAEETGKLKTKDNRLLKFSAFVIFKLQASDFPITKDKNIISLEILKLDLNREHLLMQQLAVLPAELESRAQSFWNFDSVATLKSIKQFFLDAPAIIRRNPVISAISIGGLLTFLLSLCCCVCCFTYIFKINRLSASQGQRGLDRLYAIASHLKDRWPGDPPEDDGAGVRDSSGEQLSHRLSQSWQDLREGFARLKAGIKPSRSSSRVTFEDTEFAQEAELTELGGGAKKPAFA